MTKVILNILKVALKKNENDQVKLILTMYFTWPNTSEILSLLHVINKINR